jgi:phosphoribosylaminoimidazolecarboxamide formyltransferase/IMP cyclohydrolase/phosphoribosylaminoimidazolecarboxamide formyltransferase
LSDVLRQIYFVEEGLELSPLARAYARARGADRLCSFGDWAALSDECDEATARLLRHEVSDGVVAPGYSPGALELLKAKRKGSYNIVRIDPCYTPPAMETKDVFGVTFEQKRNEVKIIPELLANRPTKNKALGPGQVRDLLVALITLKYTQSNSVCYAKDGQAIGVGAGQQSRIHCTQLAGAKADSWHLRQHPKVLALDFADGIGRANRDNAVALYISDNAEDVLADGAWQRVFKTRPAPLTREERAAYLAAVTGVALGSDAFFPFGDNIGRARRSGVTGIAQPGGSVRDEQVIEACDKYGIVMAFTGVRLFHH